MNEVKTAKGLALLSYLAVSQKPAQRPYLAALFWPDMPESQALMNLRQVLARLRPLKPYLAITRGTVSFNQESGCCVDAVEFEEGVAASHDVSRVQEAVALYRGDFLDGVMLPDAPLFEEWVLARRAQLREAALAALGRLVVHFQREGAYETAETYARQMLDIEPWHEQAHRQLISLLALSGQRAKALAQFESCRRLLADELGVAPAAETIQLAEQIRAGEMGAVGAAPPNNLPPNLTPFVGRAAELAQLQERLAAPDVHLITIIGPGGMGKTRLALALAASQLSERRQPHPFRHGIYFVSLARLESAALILPAIAQAISFKVSEYDDLHEQLLHLLASRAMLLVLDNFEHLLDGAGLVDEILRAAPQVKLLVTSRARLSRQAEQLFPIGSLAYPPENEVLGDRSFTDLTGYGAVELFVQSARRIRPDFDLTSGNQSHIATICRQLQGMPLGIVLAASWLDSLSPRAISREMQRDIDFLSTEMADMPERQRSLRAAFNHSWRLLSDREGDTFRRMSVFRGGFTRVAARAVTGAEARDLQALTNKSLLALSPDSRYVIHEMLRQFAAEKLSLDPGLEAAVRDRHSAYYCHFLAEHAPNWRNARQLESLAAVTREADNVGRAWRWAVQQGAWRLLNEGIVSWARYHQCSARKREGERVCQELIEASSHRATAEHGAAGERLLLRAQAQHWYGTFAASVDTAVPRLQKALDILGQLAASGQDVRQETVVTSVTLADRFNSTDRQRARELLERALRLSHELEDSWCQAVCLARLAHLDWGTGHYIRTQQRLEASLRLLEREGDRLEQASVLHSLAWVQQHLGHLDEAERLRRRSVALGRQLAATNIAYLEAGLATTLTWQGRIAEGQQMAAASLSACKENYPGAVGAIGFAGLALGIASLLRGHYGPARSELTRALAATKAGGGRGIEASVHCWLGNLALAEADYGRAQSAFERGLRLYQEVTDNYIFWAWSGLGLCACCQENWPAARRNFTTLLSSALELRDFLYLLTGLPGIALYLARRGQLELAVAAWAQAQSWPYVANSTWHEDIVGRAVAQAAATLPPEIAETARENGRSQTIWEMGEALLAHL